MGNLHASNLKKTGALTSDSDSSVLLEVGSLTLSQWIQSANPKLWWSYLPTPPFGQDMTQGQFLNGV